ncbi:uncharacterized protein [Primulina eburnea]|uniref:uncharacterized protein n=1 Tax=Primulina eburnea TaxID=1245227 RepID=UPI003C6BF724
MSKICISSCVEDARSPVRATYVNLYKWPESDVEFMESAAVHGRARLHSRVVDSISCRQMYLRSYTFSKKETPLEKTLKCLGKVREMVATVRERKWRTLRMREFRLRVVMKEVKDFSAAAFRAIFRRLLSCTTPMDVKELDF